MTSITPAELTLLRSRPHETNLWLSIYDPLVILACQVTGSTAAPGDRIINYDNVTPGSWGYTAVQTGMTMYVGTTLGAKDVGRIRVRSATPTTITVAENSDIKWADNLYLTIVNFWEINAVYPRMEVPDLADPTQQIWYKDYDIAHTNQNNLLGTFICMGSHHAAFIDPDSNIASIYYTSTGTSSLLGTAISTYSWEFQGGLSGTSSIATPGFINYAAPGHYTTTLSVTDANGVNDVSHRHVSIYNRPGKSLNIPILNWELISLDGSRDGGGYQARIKIRENIEDVIDGSLIVIFADDAYGGTKGSIGGNARNRQTIFFVGYILDSSISYNYEDSSVEFNVGSPTEVMKLTEGMVTSVRSSSDPAGEDIVDNDIPSAWALLKDMNCKRAIYHYLRWHSTVLMTNDFEFRGGDKYIEYFDSDRESLYDAVSNFMRGTLYGDVVCDRQGKIHAEVGAATYDTTTFTNVVMDITKQDWIGSPSIEETFNYRLSYLEMGGIQFIPAATGTFGGTSFAYLSCAPGVTPGYHGNVQSIQGMAFVDQDNLNDICGNVFAALNSKYSHVGFELSGDYRNIDIAPLEVITLNLEANDNPQRLVWNKKSFYTTEMSWNYDPQQGTLLPSLTLHEITTSSYKGTTIIIPPIPPTVDPGGGGFDIPPITIPPFVFPPGFGFLAVYHNGVFVALVSGLNFVDS